VDYKFYGLCIEFVNNLGSALNTYFISNIASDSESHNKESKKKRYLDIPTESFYAFIFPKLHHKSRIMVRQNSTRK